MPRLLRSLGLTDFILGLPPENTVLWREGPIEAKLSKQYEILKMAAPIPSRSPVLGKTVRLFHLSPPHLLAYLHPTFSTSCLEFKFRIKTLALRRRTNTVI